VNNIDIITLYKVPNELSCESRLSRLSCRACRAIRACVECVEPWCSTSSIQPKCMGSTHRTCQARHVERVESCHVETWRAKWNLDCSRFFNFPYTRLLFS